MTADAKGPKMRAVGQNIFEDNGCGNHVCRIGLHGRTEKEAMNIATILAQAGTIYAETGLTPRELLADRDRFGEALEKLRDCDWTISLPDAMRDIARKGLGDYR